MPRHDGVLPLTREAVWSPPRRLLALVAVVLCLFVSVSAAAPAPGLVDGDRVVFLGDSITAGYQYTRFVELYFRLRHPELRLSFHNAGVGGHTLLNALERLDHDVLSFRPTVVFVNFGMNDAGFSPPSEHADFERHLGTLLTRLENARVRRVVLLEPTQYDVRGLPERHAERRRQERIEEIAGVMRRVGEGRKLTVVPWFELTGEALAAESAAGKGERKLIPDRVHPGERLHASMAAALLESLGAALVPGSVEFTYEGGRLRRPAGRWKVTRPWDGESPIALDLSGAPSPLLWTLDSEPVRGARGELVRGLARMLVRVTGLPPTPLYRLEAGTTLLGEFTADEMAAGVDLMSRLAPRQSPKAGTPKVDWCSRAEGNPFENDYYCLFDLVRGRDNVRLSFRSDRIKPMPDFPYGRLRRFVAEQEAWSEELEREISSRVRAIAVRPRVLRLVPVVAR